jgi:hypothetical protein
MEKISIGIKTIIKVGNKEIELNEDEVKQLIEKLEGEKKQVQFIPYPVMVPYPVPEQKKVRYCNPEWESDITASPYFSSHYIEYINNIYNNIYRNNI